MNIYEITFKDKDAAFFTYARIKNFYKHQNEQAVLPQFRINASTIRVPQQALSLVERIAGAIQARYSIKE